MSSIDKAIKEILDYAISLPGNEIPENMQESVKETPERILKFYKEFFSPKDFKFTTFKAESKDLIIVNDIPFYSFCEHHMLPFYGKAHIAYVPNERIAGLSKLARTVDYFSHRLQVQERLTNQIADFMNDKLAPAGVAVVIQAEHMCMTLRGVQKPGTYTTTSTLRGSFSHNPFLKDEFQRFIEGFRK